jgi:lipopolysaccharide export system permease protein
MFIAPETKVYISTYHKHDSTGTGFRLEKYDDLRLTYMLKARSFEYLPETQKWRLRDYDIRHWEGDQEFYFSGRNMQIDTAISLYPSDFVYFINDKEMMTSKELLSFIRYEKERGVGTSKVMQAEYHRRWAEPFSIIILTLIGASISSRKLRGGMGLHLAMGVLLGALFIFLSKFALTFTTNLNVPPLIAMWLPNTVFGVLAWYLVQKAQK